MKKTLLKSCFHKLVGVSGKIASKDSKADINIIYEHKVRPVHGVDRSGNGWPSRTIQVKEGSTTIDRLVGGEDKIGIDKDMIR